jgi:NAD(P)-dependent dehydrogenase (short-subunit alcohol dehydrogenase family)
MSEIRYDGRVAVITGAGGGLGKTYALMLASRGASVVVNDLGGASDGTGGGSSAADQTVKEILAKGGRAVANYDSVSTPEGGEAIVRAAIESFGKVDIVINNAGILRDKSFAKLEPKDLEAVIAVHLLGAFYVSQPAFRVMKEHSYGRFVFTASGAGIFGNFGQTNYGAAKAGIMGLMWSCANGLKKYNVTANSVMPSGATRMIDSTPRGQQVYHETGKWPSELAAGTERDPDNVAPLVVYLCSDASAGVSGQVFASIGYQIVRLEMPRFVRALRGRRRWEPEEVAEWFPKTLGDGGLLEPPAAGGFGERLRAMSDEEFIPLADGVLSWRANDV